MDDQLFIIQEEQTWQDLPIRMNLGANMSLFDLNILNFSSVLIGTIIVLVNKITSDQSLSTLN